MSSLQRPETSQETLLAVLRDQLPAPLEARWFDEAPSSGVRRSSAPPPVSVGEFLGDPLADAWLR